MKRWLPLLALLLIFTGCGGSSSNKTTAAACLAASHGHGQIGACAPPQVHARLAPFRSSGGITYPDLSNNDPCICGGALRAHGHPGEIDKANQGTGFIDGTFLGMIADAKRHGLAVGGYDFDQDYTVAEVYLFINRLHAAGIWRSTPNTFPPTLDVEYGNASRAGLEHQIAVLFRVYGRVQVYTGAWYWFPHFGCWIPRGVSFWLAGYPNAPLLCGLAEYRFVSHQYTDHGFNGGNYSDMSVWRGSAASFAAFVQAPRAHIEPKPSVLHARLARALYLQKILRREIAKHGGSHGPPHPRRYAHAWHHWINEGRALIRQIGQLRHEGAR